MIILNSNGVQPNLRYAIVSNDVDVGRLIEVGGIEPEFVSIDKDRRH